MNPSGDTEAARFRDEVREFGKSWASRADPFQVFKDRSGVSAEIYRSLGERDWLSIGWGGYGRYGERAPLFEFILWDELAYQRLVRPSLAAGIVAKSLIAAGSEQQKSEYLPRIGSGEFSFALGYSEPEAGSDLAGLQCRAISAGDRYVIRGEKRWTSDAHHSDALWLLARTGPADSGTRGLSLFIVDLRASGVVISPIPTLDGHQLNTVHLDDVEVEADRLVGQPGEAWPIVQRALAEERHLQVLPGRLRRDFEDLVAWSIESETLVQPELHSQLAQIAADIDMVEAGCWQLVTDAMLRRDSLLLAARQKLIGTELMQRIARLPSERGDPGCVVEGSPFWMLWRQCILETIAGGTTQVMRDMIARKVLGLGAGRNNPTVAGR